MSNTKVFKALAQIAVVSLAFGGSASAQTSGPNTGYDKSGRSTGDASAYPGKPQGVGASAPAASDKPSSDPSSGASSSTGSAGASSGDVTPRPSGSGPSSSAPNTGGQASSTGSGPTGVSGKSVSPGN